MGKFPFIVEHVAFAQMESFCLNSYKNGKIPKNMGKFPFIVEHVAFAKRESFCLNFYKNGKIPIKMGKFLKIWESSHLLLNT